MKRRKRFSPRKWPWSTTDNKVPGNGPTPPEKAEAPRP